MQVAGENESRQAILSNITDIEAIARRAPQAMLVHALRAKRCRNKKQVDFSADVTQGSHRIDCLLD